MEKMNFRNRFALLLAILIAPLAGVSAAGLIDVDGYGRVNTETRVNDERPITNTANTEANVRANTNVKLDANVGNESRTSNSSTTSNGSATVETGRDGGVEVNAGKSGNVIRIDRSSEEVKSGSRVNVTVDRVMTDTDLKAYVASEIKSDDNFNGVNIGDDKIEVDYKQPARFLGIIPMMVSVGVNINADGSVNVDYPWYSFLSLTNKSDLEAAIKSEVKAFLEERANVGSSQAALSGNASTTASTTASVSSTTPRVNTLGMTGITVLTPSAKASLIARIHALLKAHLTNGSGNASTTQANVNL